MLQVSMEEHLIPPDSWQYNHRQPAMEQAVCHTFVGAKLNLACIPNNQRQQQHRAQTNGNTILSPEPIHSEQRGHLRPFQEVPCREDLPELQVHLVKADNRTLLILS